MARPVKTQWNFGELFPPEQVQKREVLSVTQLTARVRRLLEKEFGQVWVAGEITNLRLQSSGHIYFTLKDAGAQLSCVLFRGELQADRSLLQDGKRVILRGEITVYEPRGQYQLLVTRVELEGLGALQAAFERLKEKLKAEGLFDPGRKRSLPRFPQRVGVVTSPTGAAIRDIGHVVGRRNPSLEIVLAPCRVQGEGAGEEIAGAIRLLNRFHAERGGGLDLIVVTRGGGSLEDLWAFNEEVVARAIFDSALPVVSAVGHEIDFTISDMVADVRAATPSAAAEILTEGVYSSCQFVGQVRNRLRQRCLQQLEDKRYRAGQAFQRLGRMHPRRVLNDFLQHLDDLQAGMLRCGRQGIRQQRVAFENLVLRLARVRPGILVRQRSEVFRLANQRLGEQVRHTLRERHSRVEGLQTRLRLLGPEQVLARGYSITTDAGTGRVVRDAGDTQPGQTLRTRLAKGQVISRVEPG